MGKTGSGIVAVREHEDFEAVYDLPDPRSYYRALRPLDYRMPTVACDYLTEHAERIAAARGVPRLRLLDFACGYAANGALLHHDLTLNTLFAFYEGDAEGEAAEHDEAFFRARRHPEPGFEIGGLDVAATALDYANRCGLLDHAFAENLLAAEPSDELHSFLASTDIVFESGGLGDLLAPCFSRLLDCMSGARQPWFLYSPRGNLDEAPLLAMFAERSFLVESCSPAPFRYRRVMSAREESETVAAIQRDGREPADHLREGYFINPLRLARPREDASALPVSEIMLSRKAL